MFTKEFLFLFIKTFLLVLLGYLIFWPIFAIVRKLSRLTICDLKTLMKMYKYKRHVVDHSVNHALLLSELYTGLQAISLLNSMDGDNKQERATRMSALSNETNEILTEIDTEIKEFKKLFIRNKMTDLETVDKITRNGDHLVCLVDTSVKRLLLKASDYMFGQIEVECVEDIMNMTIHCKNTDRASIIYDDGAIKIPNYGIKNKGYSSLTEYFNQLEEITKVASYDKCNLHIIID